MTVVDTVSGIFQSSEKLTQVLIDFVPIKRRTLIVGM